MGQSLDQMKGLAKQYYEAGKFLEAVDFFQRVHEVNPSDEDAHFKLAMSLSKSLQYEKAKNEFQAILNRGVINDEILFQYGVLLKTASLYSEADSVFSILLSLPTLTSKYESLGKLNKEGCELGIRLSRVKNTHQFQRAEKFCTPFHDFGLIEDNSGLIAYTSNSKSRGKQYVDGQYGGYLPNIIGFTDKSVSSRKSELFKNVNNRWAQGTGSFSKNGNALYFSSCEKGQTCRIMVSRKDTIGVWGNPIALGDRVNLPGYDTQHPYISITGDTLFFSSNRPHGFGGLDLWMSLRIDQEEWSPPINMGAVINSQGDEVCPFYFSDFGAFLFSSNGHAGYGGFDIYMAKGTSFFSPNIFNIGPPFNSPYDDNYFFLGQNGYLSSNRGKSDFDIFEFQYQDKDELLRSFMSNDALVELIQLDVASLDLHTYRLEEFEGYHIFSPREKKVAKSTKGNYKMVVGNASPETTIRATLSDTLEMLTRTNLDGYFEIRLIEENQVVDAVNEKDSVKFKISAMDFSGFKYEFENIYFDFDDRNLRDESMETLRDILRVFRKDNIVMVDIHTHTDFHGAEHYNYRLSEERGLSILGFLESEGLENLKLRVFPKGETKLKTASDDWYNQLFNRRSEIFVYTLEPVSFTKPEIFIIHQDVTLNQASKSLGISKSDIIEWNGLSESTLLLKAGHVLRVFDPKHLTPNYNYLIPEEKAGYSFQYYIVQAGDTLEKIAKDLGVIEEILMEANHLSSPIVVPGQEIVISREF